VPPTYSPTQTPGVTRQPLQAPPSRGTREDPPSSPTNRDPATLRRPAGWVSMVPLVSNPGRRGRTPHPDRENTHHPKARGVLLIAP